MNSLYVLNLMKPQGLPVFTLELVFDTPEIADAIHVYSKSYMFHKERLYRVLEKHVPEKYTKLIFLDADVYFEDKNWYQRLSSLLDNYDVVQPFDNAVWLDLSYTTNLMTAKSFPMITYRYNAIGNKIPIFDGTHPGLAWAMRREWYNNVGFFDFCILGGGDKLSAVAWMKINNNNNNMSEVLPCYRKEYTTFCMQNPARITYLQGSTIYHLFHGHRKNRKYQERYQILKNYNDDIHDLIFINDDGVFEWKQPDLFNSKFLEYFISRGDDDI